MLEDHNDNTEFWSGVPERRRLRRSTPTPSASNRRARAARTLSSRDTGAHRAISREITRPVERQVEPSFVRDERGRPERHSNQGMRRAGVLGGTLLLLVPVAMALRAEAEGPRQVAPVASSLTTAAEVVASTADPGAAFVTADGAPATVAIEALRPIVPDPTEAPAKDSPHLVAPAPLAPARVTTTIAKKTTPKKAASKCVPYTVLAGDAWISIAHRAGVSLGTLLTVNNARTTTSLMPGRAICLPAGASMPAASKNATAKNTNTKNGAATTAGTRTADTVKAATVNAGTVKGVTSGTTHSTASTTTLPALVAPVNTYSRDDVMQIIREVWPDDLEDQAIAIADRESHLNPSARNFCCYGLFQLYYSVHRTWLGTLGVTDAAQLWDPTVNATVAYQMYLRNGFAPWGG